MLANEVFRQLRFIFNWSEADIAELFKLADAIENEETIQNWLHKPEHESFVKMKDVEFTTLLNGFIIAQRGKREGPSPKPEMILNNNIILRKLKIALNLKDTDILNLFQSVDLRLSKHELSAFFRNPKQAQYRECQDQFLRNFLFGLKKKYRPEST